MFSRCLVVVKGGGDLATGVAYRLFRSGFPVAITELAQPTVVRRTVAFAQAVFDGETVVEGVAARRIDTPAEVWPTLREGKLPVIVDPQARIIGELRPTVMVDAIMAKRNTATRLSDAPIVIALGPGFVAGVDAHAVIETNRGHHLGRVLWSGEAEPNTGIPGPIGGYTVERVLRAPTAGIFTAARKIGDRVAQGDVVAWVDEQPVVAEVTGVLRGLLQEGLPVAQGMKVGDIDPRAEVGHCFTISDKALAIGGGVLEAVLTLWQRLPQE